MNDINKRNIYIPILVQVTSWVLIIIMLMGIIFLGDRTPVAYLINGLIVISTGITTLMRPKILKHIIMRLIIGIAGVISLSVLIVNDLTEPPEYTMAVIKSFIFILYVYLIISVFIRKSE